MLHLHRRKARALLAYLAVRAGQPLPREAFVGLLWPDVDAGEARHSLRQTLTVLGRDLGPLGWPASLLGGEALCLPGALVRADVADSDRLARSPEGRHLERAVMAYRGDFLEGLVTGEEAFDGWLAGERERLRGAAIHALDGLVAIHLKTGAAALAARAAVRLLARDPLREDVHCLTRSR